MGLGIKIPRNALSKAVKDFKDNPNGDNIELEPGTYLAVITGMKGVETQKGPQVVIECKIGGDVDDAIKGGKVALWFSFDEDRVIHLLRFLAKLGYDVDDLDVKMLEEHAEAIKDAKHVIRLKAAQSKDGEYVNVRMNKVMTDMSADEVLAGEGDAGEDDAEEETPKKKEKSKPKEDAEEEEDDEEEEEKPKKKSKKEDDEEEEEEPAKKKKKDEDEEEDEEEEEEEKEEDKIVKVGLKVKAKIKGELVKGVIVEVDHDEGKVVIKAADGKKYRLSPDKLED